MFYILRLLLLIIPLNWLFQIWTAFKIKSIRDVRKSEEDADKQKVELKGSTRYVISAAISVLTMLFTFYVTFVASVRSFTDLDGYLSILGLVASVGLIPLIPVLSLKFSIDKLVEAGIVEE